MSKQYSTILKTFVLPLADRAMRTNIASSYKKIKQMQQYSRDEIKAWQEKRLKSLIEHAYNNSKYYNTLFKQIGLHPDEIKTSADLKKIPVLTKKIIRDNFNDIISENNDSIPYKKSATGGSTGDPMKYWLDHRSWSMSIANTIYNWEKIGYNYGDAYIALGSTSLFVDKKPSLKHQIYYLIKNKTGLNGINMSDDVCKEYIAFIKKREIRFIYGYASSIYLLAKYASENNQNLTIKTCFPTSEVLTDRFRKTIQETFGCKILNCYGAGDGGITAFSHELDFFEVGYNCLVRIENPGANGAGPALVTDLSNYAMPLINYKLGDEIRIDTSKNKDYPYNGQIINDILGRSSDIIQLENGHTLTGPGFTILFKDLPVEHYCVVKNGVNSIKCNVVKLSDFDQSHEDIIRATFRKQMGDNTNFGIEYINEIPLSKSGKREYFKKS